jgi:hypothetical protein
VSIVIQVVVANDEQRFIEVPDSTGREQDEAFISDSWDAFRNDRGSFAGEWLETLDGTLVRKSQITEAGLLTV